MEKIFVLPVFWNYWCYCSAPLAGRIAIWLHWVILKAIRFKWMLNAFLLQVIGLFGTERVKQQVLGSSEIIKPNKHPLHMPGIA